MAKFTFNTDDIKERVLESLGLTTQQQASSLAARAFESGFFDGLNGNDEPPSGTLASYGYRRQTSHGLRDFTKLNQDQLINIAWVLYQSNPLAKRYFEIVRDHVLGRGVEPVVKDDDLREIVETFWQRNKMDEQLQKFVVQLRLFGEQCYPVFVRETDGRTTLGYIDPANIEHVVTHPHNVLEKYAVILKYDSAAPRTRKIYRIVRKDEGYIRGRVVVIMPSNPDKLVTWEQAQIEPWEQALLEANGLTEYSGSCFYYSVNNVSNQPRGFSDLLQVADWLDADDETLFALADREQMAGYFAWDVTLINVPKEEIQTRAAEIRGRIPRKGQVNVHNDKEVWEMKAPDLKQQGTIATSDSLSDRSWGMLGLPKPWRGIGEDSNKASATAMGEPTRKTLEQKQDVAKTMILEFLAFVRDQAAIAGAWTGKEQDIDVTMPEMTRTDMQEVSTTLGNLGTALTVLMNDLQLITRATAAKATSKVMAEIGVEYDPTEELEAAEKEAKEREEEQGVTGDAADKFLQQQLKMKALAGKNGLPAKATNGIEPEEDE